MKRLILSFFLILGSTGAWGCEPASDWIRMEVLAPEAAAMGTRVVSIDTAGCLRVDYPPQHLKRGAWTRRLPGVDMGRLIDAMASLPTEQTVLDRELQQQRAALGPLAERRIIVDGEVRILEWRTSQGARRLQARAPLRTEATGGAIGELAEALRVIESLLGSPDLARTEAP